MDILTAKLGANMAINSLEKSGQIGCVGTEVKELFTCPGPLFPEDKFDGIFYNLEDNKGPFLEEGKTYRIIRGEESEAAVCVAYPGKVVLKAFYDADYPAFQYEEYYNTDGYAGGSCVVGGHSFSVEGEVDTVRTIDPKFLPCLTSPSGKQFKLTVDDNGILSVTEI